MIKAKEKPKNFSEEIPSPEEAQPTNGSEKQSPIADPETMKKELEEARQKVGENLDCWQRERADFMNYRKRIEREQDTLKQTVTGTVIKKYLVILDDIERALKARPIRGDGAVWAEGIDLIYRKLQGILEAEGISRIPAESEIFDPNRHEAISHEESADHASGEIIEVIQQGYLLCDRVLRHALVRVAK
jgi:molecular chaperone GrpE